MSDQTRRIGVVLVNYQSRQPLTDLLESGAVAGAGQVVLVDNGDDPEAIRSLAELHGAHLVLLPENLGFAAGVNAGVAVLETELVLLLNPDVALAPADLSALVDHLDGTGADGVAALLQEPSGRLQVGAAGGPLTAWSFTSYFLFLSHLLPVRGIFLTRAQSRVAGRADWLSMACLLARRSTFATYGPVPEDEIVYGEDVAWGTAATEAGAHFQLASHVIVQHAHGSSGSSAAWTSALERLARRRMTPVAAHLAVTAMRLGLLLRRAMGRDVTSR
jgi:N-acetylglucosaminyl-diphospho-decaprenol L-rhamnosyltransferase